MKILLANPRGFCAGVERAIAIVERALEEHGAPVYVRHEVVHNQFVVNNLRLKGAIFVDEIEDIPTGAIIILSAHGVSQKIRKKAETVGRSVYDATCPLVHKVHKEVRRKQKNEIEVILIGHNNHPEVEGTLGQSKIGKMIHLVETIEDIKKLNLNAKQTSYTTQTTLSVDDTQEIIKHLKKKFPTIQAPAKDDICYATQNRQNAVKRLLNDCQMLLVIGSVNSSNSNRLCEIASKSGVPAHLIDGVNEIESLSFKGVSNLGITAGASAPEVLVQSVIDYFRTLGVSEVVETNGTRENVHFPLPSKLR